MRIGGFDQIRSKRQRLVDVLRWTDVDIAEAVAHGVGGTQLPGSLVDVDGDDSARRRSPGEGEGDRPGTTPEVEEHAVGRRRRRLAQEQLRAGVEAPVAEHPAVRAERERWVDEIDDDLALVRGRLLLLREVVRHVVGSLAVMSAPIRVFGDPVLKTKAAPVADIDGKAVRLVDDMFDSLYDCEQRARAGGSADRGAEAGRRVGLRGRPAGDLQSGDRPTRTVSGSTRRAVCRFPGSTSS